jgi:hypothetical protein
MPNAPIILTRPEAEANMMAAELTAQGAHCIVSPLMCYRTFTNVLIPPRSWQGVIVTSPRALMAVDIKELKALPLWAVGTQTMLLAKQLRWQGNVHCYNHVRDMLEATGALRGPLLYLSGRHTTQPITSEHITSVVVYEVVHEGEWTPEAKQLLSSSKPILLPVLSERSAARLAECLHACGQSRWPHCQIIALSEKIVMPIASVHPGGLYWPSVPTQAALMELLLSKWKETHA